MFAKLYPFAMQEQDAETSTLEERRYMEAKDILDDLARNADLLDQKQGAPFPALSARQWGKSSNSHVCAGKQGSWPIRPDRGWCSF